MRFNPVPLIAVLLMAYCSSNAQVDSLQPADERYRVLLKSGSFIPIHNIADEKIGEMNRTAYRPGGKSLVVIQFEKLPGASEKQQLKQAGIELLEYVPHNAYTAVVTGFLNASVLKQVRSRAIFSMSAEQKMEPLLVRDVPPGTTTGGNLDLWVSFPKSFSVDAVKQEMQLGGFDIVSTHLAAYQILVVRIAAARLYEMAALPWVSYVQKTPNEDQPLNNNSRASSNAGILNSSLPGARKLNGEGVVVGVGDNADPTRHIDFTGRVINRAANMPAAHGMHVMGTVGGAGIRNERLMGFAPKSTIIAQSFSGIVVNAPTYVQDHGMTITNNSYGNTYECGSMGSYDLISRILDEQTFMMPHLQHVFAAGNSGQSVCSPFPAGFNTVLGGYQAAKNVISVGNVDGSGLIYYTSSRGPVSDGRIKPEVVAPGELIFSTTPTNGYSLSNGTSMSSPAVSGGLALLYERYRQLHAGGNPESGLMKALICNGATDRGNPGPDFMYGFGQMNLLRSVEMLEKGNYFNASVASAGSNTHSINIPSGSNIARLKVMLYWNDPAAPVFASNALVNDLDLRVTDPATAIYLPLVLNTAPASVNLPATTGIDRINNIEQVVIENPAPGDYDFIVEGTTIPFGGQHDYYLVFDTIPVSTFLTYPAGGEKLQGAETVIIHWESAGHPSNNFTLQFSADDGATWTDVVNGVNLAANLRQLSWQVPAVATHQARLKITHTGTGLENISEAFTILGVPTISMPGASSQCEGYIRFNWTAVAGATDYEVMLFRGVGEMMPIATTTATTFLISGLSNDTTYWVTARARLNGVPGRRGVAVSRLPDTGTCAGTISDKDLKLDAIISPASSGRKFTTTELGSSVPVTVRIENLDNAVTSGNITISYQLNNNPPVTETIIAPNIGNRLSYTYTFATPADMSALGNHHLRVYISYTGDPVALNDTLSKTYKQLDNPFIDLATDFIDDLETAADQALTGAQVGLTGLDRYDFNATSAFGQVRTFINTGIPYSGNRALTIDSKSYNLNGTSDSLTATFNLLGYNTATDDIRLDFMYKHHDQPDHASNKVWIRGDDQQTWIEVFDLFANQADVGVYRRSASIELNNILASASPPQSFSSSMQVRWGQWGELNAADNESGSGYTFDDIRLYRAFDDIQILSIDNPHPLSCGLDAAVPVRITIRNSVHNVITGIPVNLQVDDGLVITETITSIPGNSSLAYTFAASANLAVPGYHKIKVWADHASDSFRENDTLEVSVFNAPLITSFPYLQDFETDEGWWHAEGKRNSWQYGTPVSAKINRAASGTWAWKTSLGSQYNSQEKSYLISPCFDVTGLTNPMLSFSIALDLEDCDATLCDAAYVEYSADGNDWTRLGTNGTGTNWYNKDYNGHSVWSIQNYTRWHVASIPLPAGINSLRIRFVMESDPFVTREGIAIDDIHIYDSVYSIFDGPPHTSPVVSQPGVAGSGWIDFVTGGQIVASVNPNAQDLGNTDCRAFIHTGAVRANSLQYYHNRNITIKPATVNLADSVTIRFYFLDSETEALINASGCSGCSKPASAYELGISKYSSPDMALENGSLADNNNGNWSFITPANVRKVPYDKGYYAEFRVKDFSEFWLNNGGPANDQPLPVELKSFTVKKNDAGDVLLNWVTASENNTDRFEIELARGHDAIGQNNFVKIGSVDGAGQSSVERHYNFTDFEPGKRGLRYYRLKMTDLDGQYTYSAVRSLLFDDDIKWQVYPNPSAGVFHVVFQAGDGEPVTIRVMDMYGRVVHELRSGANALVQKITIDLQSPQYSTGIYLLQLDVKEKRKLFKLLKK